MALTIINGNLRSPSGFKVAPQSYISIEKEAIALQDLLKENDCFIGHSVDSLKVLEVMLPKYGYNYHYADDSTMGNNAAFTIPDNNLVVLRNSIYDNLLQGGVFGRSTVIHELSHIVLQHHITFNRSHNMQASNHKHYEDSEWQAKSLTAAIMMPIEACASSNNNPIQLSLMCGTSAQAAEYRLETYNERIAKNFSLK